MKDLTFYLKLAYTIKVVPYPYGRYFVEIKELPGCIAEGDIKEEVLEMIEDSKNSGLKSLYRKV